VEHTLRYAKLAARRGASWIVPRREKRSAPVIDHRRWCREQPTLQSFVRETLSENGQKRRSVGTLCPESGPRRLLFSKRQRNHYFSCRPLALLRALVSLLCGRTRKRTFGRRVATLALPPYLSPVEPMHARNASAGAIRATSAAASAWNAGQRPSNSSQEA